jgi:hypothetical protein
MTAATVKMPRCSVAVPTEKYLLSEDLDPTREGFKCAKTECGELFATTAGVITMLLLFADNLDIQILVELQLFQMHISVLVVGPYWWTTWFAVGLNQNWLRAATVPTTTVGTMKTPQFNVAVPMEKLPWSMDWGLTRGGFRFAWMKYGEQSAMTTGPVITRLFFANNWDLQQQVYTQGYALHITQVDCVLLLWRSHCS